MREIIAEALKTAQKAQDKRRVATLRLAQAAIHDRDIAHRGAGKDPVTDEEIVQILAKMVKQREESARIYEEASRIDLALGEREEIEILKEFLPRQLDEEGVKNACQNVIKEIGADGLR
ncbi:glutamyl-tRNA amidotransferase, partial [Salmonella enterica subsp. enterica serovar Java]|nr:glutamyl-tRNA amidotransferase [Salmonella enterica subsp. enterica serovar Java]